MKRLQLIAALCVAMFTTQAWAGVKGEEVVYTVDGKEYTGYLAYDDSNMDKRPGVLVVHEWWGHNAHARDKAEKLAGLGYTALALDMYGTGKLAEHPKDANEMMMSLFKDPAGTKAKFDKALEVLKGQATVDSDNVAAIGYCMGGAIVLSQAIVGADLKGVVSFHGGLGGLDQVPAGDVKAKVRVYNGADDVMVKPEHISAFEAKMKDVGADFQIMQMEGAMHSFTNPEADAIGKKFGIPVAYNKAADEKSWAGMQAFFKEIF